MLSCFKTYETCPVEITRAHAREHLTRARARCASKDRRARETREQRQAHALRTRAHASTSRAHVLNARALAQRTPQLVRHHIYIYILCICLFLKKACSGKTGSIDQTDEDGWGKTVQIFELFRLFRRSSLAPNISSPSQAMSGSEDISGSHLWNVGIQETAAANAGEHNHQSSGLRTSVTEL